MRWLCAVLAVAVICCSCSRSSKKRKGGGNNAPTAAFTANPTSGTAPLTVSFTDNSTGNITSWQWSFGDGGTSTTQSPTHTYNNPGTYTVTLTVSGPGGSDSASKTITVNQSTSLPSYVVEFDNINVAVEDDATQSRLEELGEHLKDWAHYLWELTGGQMCVRKFTISDQTTPQYVGDYLIYIPRGLLDEYAIGGGAYGMYSPTYDLIYVAGKFPIMTLLHEFCHARLQHTPYEEYAYNGSCKCIMGPSYYMRWCDDSNHTNSCPISCWASFLQRYSDWVPPHDSSGNTPPEWGSRSSKPCPSVTYEIHNN